MVDRCQSCQAPNRLQNDQSTTGTITKTALPFFMGKLSKAAAAAACECPKTAANGGYYMIVRQASNINMAEPMIRLKAISVVDSDRACETIF